MLNRKHSLPAVYRKTCQITGILCSGYERISYTEYKWKHSVQLTWFTRYVLGKESFLFNIAALIRVYYPYSQVPQLTLFEQN